MLSNSTPIAVSSFPSLAPLVRITRLTAEISADPRLESGVTLAARLRGAFGHKLAALANTDSEARLAWESLFSEKDATQIRSHSPAPFLVTADEKLGGGLLATLSLFGFADRWRDTAFPAFIAALSEPPGIALAAPDGKRRPTPLRAPLAVTSVRWTRREGVDLPGPANRYCLSFVTPVQFGPSQQLSHRFEDVIVGLAERVSLLAPHMGCKLEVSLSVWRDIARGTRIDASRMRPVHWTLWSTSRGQGNGQGWLGDLLLSNSDPELPALLAIGEQLSCGREAAKGFGRYQLYGEP